MRPVTRFAKRNEKVLYEIAQIRFCVVNTNPESKKSSPEGIRIYVDDEVLVREIPPVDSRNTLINETVNARTKGTVIRSHFTSSGLVFVTLSDDSLPFREFFPDLEPLLARVDFTKLKYRRSIAYEGDFNWKTM
ncbi:hypothetical protein Q9L58_008078 [Maublancomyces gigas]|uniref:Uncharacterized protein n=1 Tax=Discina gigas TaxID=1032678 RepID=A0ABR3GB27_9PEZI